MSGVFYHSAIHGLGFFICFIRLELIPVSVDASPLQDYPPSIKFAGTLSYTWVERGTARVQCLAEAVYN